MDYLLVEAEKRINQIVKLKAENEKLRELCLSRFVRHVSITEDGTEEPVQYAAVHPLRWKDHLKVPTAAFVEIDEEWLNDALKSGEKS